MGTLSNPSPIKVLLAAVACAAISPAQDAGEAKPAQATPLSDAPHFFHQKDGSVIAKWIEVGEVKSKKFAKGKPVDLPKFATLLGRQLHIEPYKLESEVWKQPKKFLAISDVEGQYDYMFRFLLNSGVIDKDGHWSFGQGHFICVGDMVDRGQQVTETLLLLLRMYKEAKKAGGYVHYVLGNHEVMMMGGDIRYTHPKYKEIAALLKIPCQGLLGADTEIGRFLRTRHSLVRVGDYLFVHAGISTPINKTKLGMKKLNELVRSVLGVSPSDIKDQFTQSVAWGRLGPLWYRGYFKEFEASFGTQPTTAEMDTILKDFGAKSIVIGHTKVSKVGSMFGQRRVLAIDIPWTDVKEVRGIFVEGDKLDVVDVTGKRVPFK